jgi:hypothetical protein
MENVWLVL